MARRTIHRHAGRHAARSGFTLVEVMVSAVITILIITGVFTVFIQGLRTWEAESIMGELNMDLERALERIRADMRLSSVGIGLMSFYPADADAYTAISIPMAEDEDNDGLLDRDSEGRILWNRTVIYHVRPGTPDKLLRTEFAPRKPDATPQEIYDQLEDTVLAANDAQVANAALTGESANTRVVFENLVQMSFSPPDARYDLYAPTREKGRTFNWGSVVLDGGAHTLEFTVVGKNPASSGYSIELDRFRLSNSGSYREGELFVPANTHPMAPYFPLAVNGMTASAVNRSSEWLYSGNAAMFGTCNATGAVAAFTVHNDLWCDSNFNAPGGELSSNCSVRLDSTFTNTTPFITDVVVSMDKGVTWTANSLSDIGFSTTLRGEVLGVTNYIYGSSHTNGLAAIVRNGRWARVSFQGGTGAPTMITNAALIDAASGGRSNITFNGGQPGAFVPAGTNLWSDWVPEFAIDRSKDYRVAFTVGGAGDLDLDLFMGGDSGQIRFLENIGTPGAPSFGAGVQPWETINYGTYSAPALVDIDADGDLDLFIGGWSVGVLKFYRNTGTVVDPQYALEDADWNYIRHPLSRPTFADIDNDGDYDCFIGGQNGRIEFLRNTGSPSAPSWSAVDPAWKGIGVYQNDNPGNPSHYTAPAFADIDADGDLDLFVGRYQPGDLVMFENTGNAALPVFGVTNNPYMSINVGLSSAPAFGDIDDDGDLDLFVGDIDGTLTMYRNTGTAQVAEWGETNSNYLGVDVGTWSVPAVANINPSINSVWQEQLTTGTASLTNGVASLSYICATQIEVGYPDVALYRSGVFDTGMEAPVYRELNWTQVERYSEGGDVDIRVRSGSTPDMADADWQDAHYGDDGFFQANVNNNLASLPHRRYLQYEAMLRCFLPQGHTNSPTAILRDVTIDWTGPEGLVDLIVDFGKGPDCGIVTATVDGQPFVKGVTMEMAIYKEGRTGMHETTGTLEVRPLNTGK